VLSVCFVIEGFNISWKNLLPPLAFPIHAILLCFITMIDFDFFHFCIYFSYFLFFSSVFGDYDDEDVDDCFINHLIVVTENSAPSSATTMKKHDRTGAFVPRSKMNAFIARQISESLLEYEQEIFAANTQVGSVFERTEWDRWMYCKCGLFEFESFIQTVSQETEREL